MVSGAFLIHNREGLCCHLIAAHFLPSFSFCSVQTGLSPPTSFPRASLAPCTHSLLPQSTVMLGTLSMHVDLPPFLVPLGSLPLYIHFMLLFSVPLHLAPLWLVRTFFQQLESTAKCSLPGFAAPLIAKLSQRVVFTQNLPPLPFSPPLTYSTEKFLSQ